MLFPRNSLIVLPPAVDLFLAELITALSLSARRYALNEMDKFSLKDSGRGDSEAGDSDYEPGRESPMDRLLGEGFTEIHAPDGQHRPHAGTTLPRHPPHLPALLPTSPGVRSPVEQFAAALVFPFSRVAGTLRERRHEL